jgi:hypothetical protein
MESCSVGNTGVFLPHPSIFKYNKTSLIRTNWEQTFVLISEKSEL